MTTRNQLPSFERLHEAFDYCPDTGALTRKIPSRGLRSKAGDAVGGLTKAGYTQVVLDGRHYFAHRIIWKMQTGMEPPPVIDHRDGDNDNNRWGNLREATPTGNSCNAKRRSDNTSGFKGLSYDRKRKKWRAYIIMDRQQNDIGRFVCFGKALKSMQTARRDLHGAFARAA